VSLALATLILVGLLVGVVIVYAPSEHLDETSPGRWAAHASLTAGLGGIVIFTIWVLHAMGLK
jgi:hypothetical protein